MMEFSLPDPLNQAFALRAVQSDADAEQVIAINAEMHGEEVGDILRCWMFEGHPTISRADWLFVEQRATGAGVATLSLVPMTWRYGDATVPVAELGFVATVPEFRRRGLQRALSAAFDRLALERGFTLAAIEGIPGFYGQFGYEYGIPLGGGFHLEYGQVPEATAQGGCRLRQATSADVPALVPLYDASVAPLDIAAVRSPEIWTHQLSVPQHATITGTTTVIEREGRVVGYMRWIDDDWTDRLRILELAVEQGATAREAVLAGLRYARERGRAADKRGLTLQLPGTHPAVTVARYLGAVDGGYYGWQMRVLDPAGFMRAIAPALEARLSASLWADYTGSLTFLLYRSRGPGLGLYFERGRLVEVRTDEGQPGVDMRMAEKQATQLWLGWRDREALEGWHPDVWSNAAARHLLDVLFPRAEAYVYTPY